MKNLITCEAISKTRDIINKAVDAMVEDGIEIDDEFIRDIPDLVISSNINMHSIMLAGIATAFIKAAKNNKLIGGKKARTLINYVRDETKKM